MPSRDHVLYFRVSVAYRVVWGMGTIIMKHWEALVVLDGSYVTDVSI